MICFRNIYELTVHLQFCSLAKRWFHYFLLDVKKTFSPWLCNIEPLSQASPYPLILSLENHCSVEQQTVMARHLRSILGDKVLTKPLHDLDPHILPSPEVRRLDPWPDERWICIRTITSENIKVSLLAQEFFSFVLNASQLYLPISIFSSSSSLKDFFLKLTQLNDVPRYIFGVCLLLSNGMWMWLKITNDWLSNSLQLDCRTFIPLFCM